MGAEVSPPPTPRFLDRLDGGPSQAVLTQVPPNESELEVIHFGLKYKLKRQTRLNK